MLQKQVEKFLKTHELDIQKAKATFFVCDLTYSSYAGSDIVHEVNFTPVFCYISPNNVPPFYQILPKDFLNEVNKKIYLDYIKNPKSLKTLIKRHLAVSSELDKLWLNYNNPQKQKDLSTTYQRLIDTSLRWWHYGVIGEDKGGIIEREIIPKFAKRHKLSPAEAQNNFNILAHPQEQSVLTLERKCFLEICLNILKDNKAKQLLAKKRYEDILKKNKIIKNLADFYLKNYFWIKTDFYQSQAFTLPSLFEEISNEIKERMADDILEEREKIKISFQEIHKNKQKFFKTFKLSAEDKIDIEFSQLTSYWIDQRKLGMMKQLYYIFNIINQITEKYALSYDEISYYRVNELIDLLTSQKYLDLEILQKRKTGCFIVFKKNSESKIFFSTAGESMLNIANQLKSKKIKGTIASKGKVDKVRGIAKIISNPSKENINGDEILVTSMTRVEYLPLMRKAKAIITDEGGIACHAAIVSRELGKPCIIGTKTATRLLKNGDELELDMKTGLIKVI